MDKQVEKEFSEMVANLLQTEFCPDWDPKLLHGFMGIASESGELLEIGNACSRTGLLIELSDLLHYMQMILNVLDSSIEELLSIDVDKVYPYFTFEQDYIAFRPSSYCAKCNPKLLYGLTGIASEAGRLLNRYKKFLFYHGEPYSRREMLNGLSRLLHFMQVILDEFDSDIEEIVRVNIAKLCGARYKDGYSHDAAITHHRDKVAERAAIDKVIDVSTALRNEKKYRDEGEKND